MVEALNFLLNTVIGLFTTAVLLRFYLQLTGAPFHNPISQAVVSLTNFIVLPTRRMVPGLRGMDTSTLLLGLVSEFIYQFLSLLLKGFPIVLAGGNVWLMLIGLSLLGIIKISIYIFAYAIILQALLSWVNPYTPITPALNALTQPILGPIRRYLPSPNGLDLSPMYAFIIAELVRILFLSSMEQTLIKLVM